MALKALKPAGTHLSLITSSTYCIPPSLHCSAHPSIHIHFISPYFYPLKTCWVGLNMQKPLLETELLPCLISTGNRKLDEEMSILIFSLTLSLYVRVNGQGARVCACVCVCACVGVRDRERESVCECDCTRSACVCPCMCVCLP